MKQPNDDTATPTQPAGRWLDLIVVGGKILACGMYLKLRQSEGTELCPISTMKDMYDIVKESDQVLTF